MKRLITLVVLLSATTLSCAGEMYPGTAACHAKEDSSKCEIAWDLSASPRAYYRVEQLDPNSKAWVSTRSAVSSAASGSGVYVDEGGLYRVLACDDEGFHNNCQSSTAAWASVILPVEQIPDEVLISNGDGTTVTAGVSKNGDDKLTQNIQHNVYLMSSLVNTAAASRGVSILPPMSPPVEPGAGHDDVDHHIQHSLQVAYEALRDHFADKAER